MKAQREERERNFQSLLATEDKNLIPNATEADCPICFSRLEAEEGVVLRECLHTFCRYDAVNNPSHMSYVVKKKEKKKSLKLTSSTMAALSAVAANVGVLSMCWYLPFLAKGVSKSDSREQP